MLDGAGQGDRVAGSGNLRSLARVFLKLGFLGFGGPAAHLAMMEDEVVRRRGWLTRDHFLDLVGVTNLIPGPNSTEMAIQIGYARAGWHGLLVAGLCFIVPACLITGLLAWGYHSFGALPDVVPFLAGIKPVVLAVIAGALWRLGGTAIKDWRLLLIGVGVAAVAFQQGHEVLALLGGGILGMFWRQTRAGGAGAAAAGAVLGWKAAARTAVLGAGAAVGTAAGAASVSLWQIGLFFAKVGAVLYGSGYVLFAFLEGGLVREWGVLTQQQLLDAVAVGQVTPGPLVSTATFIGYLLGGASGAVVATLGVFLPSFAFVAAVGPLVPRLRRSAWVGAFLDAVNASAMGLMAAVVVRLGQATLVDPLSWFMAGVALLIALHWRVGTVVLLLAGALSGYANGM